MKRIKDLLRKKNIMIPLAAVLAVAVILSAVPLFASAGPVSDRSLTVLDAARTTSGTVESTGESYIIAADGIPDGTAISLDSPRLTVTPEPSVTLDGHLVAVNGTQYMPVDHLVMGEQGALVAYCGEQPAYGQLMIISDDQNCIMIKLDISPIRTTTKNGAIISAEKISSAPYSYMQYGGLGEVFSLGEMTGVEEFYYGDDADGSSVENLVPCTSVVIAERDGGYVLAPVGTNGQPVLGKNIYMVYDRLFSFDITLNSIVNEHGEDNGDAYLWKGSEYRVYNGSSYETYSVAEKYGQGATDVRPYVKTITGRIGDSFIASELDELLIYTAIGERQNFPNVWSRLSEHASDNGWRPLDVAITDAMILNTYYDKVDFFRIVATESGAVLKAVLPTDRTRMKTASEAFYGWDGYTPRSRNEYDLSEIVFYTTRPSLTRVDYSYDGGVRYSDHIQTRIQTNIMIDLGGKSYSGKFDFSGANVVTAEYNGQKIMASANETYEEKVLLPLEYEGEVVTQESNLIGFYVNADQGIDHRIPKADAGDDSKVNIVLRYTLTGELVNIDDPTDRIVYTEDEPLIYTEKLSSAKLQQAIQACPRQAGYDVIIDLTEAIRYDNPVTTIVKLLKVWDDEANRFGLRPQSIGVQLERSLDGQYWESDFENSLVTMTGDMTSLVWTATPDVETDIYNSQTGLYSQYRYRIASESIATNGGVGAEYLPDLSDRIITDITNKTTQELTVENTLTPTVTTFTTVKQWVGEPAASATLAIYQDGLFYDSAVVSAANGWQHTFTQLPVGDHEYSAAHVYTVRELDASGRSVGDGELIELDGEGYRVTISGGTVTNTPTHAVKVNYVDTEGRTIQSSADPYTDLPEGDPYNVRNTGDEKNDYRDSYIDFEGERYFYVETKQESDPESSPAIDGDKEITYVYDKLYDPTIAKAVDKSVIGKDEFVTYTLTVTNNDPHFDMHNVVVTDVVPEGLKLRGFVEQTGVTASHDGTGRSLRWVIGEITAGGTATVRFTADIDLEGSDGRAKAVWYNTAYVTEATPDTDHDGTPDSEHGREYNTPSNTVETDARYELVVEYHAYTPDGEVLRDEHHDGGLKGTDYNVNNSEVIPDVITNEEGVWVKSYITESSDPLEGVYDSDKRIVVVYDRFDNAYSMDKQVSTDRENWQDSVDVLPGTTVYFRIRVFNNTDYPLSGLSIVDEMRFNGEVTDTPAEWQEFYDELAAAVIPAKDSWDGGYALAYITSDNAEGGRYVNKATVSDNDPATPDLTDDATVNVTPVYSVKVNYVDTEGNTIQDPADPYVRLPEGEPYNVLNVGDAKNNYKDSYIDFEGKRYYYVETQADSDPESSEAIDSDKEITYVYDLLRNPAIEKAVDKDVAGKGETVTYTLTVTNNDPHFDMHNVVVTDIVPAGLRFNSFVEKEGVTATCGEDGRSLSWVIGEIPNKGTVSVSFTADVEDRTKAVWYNTAYVTEATPDIDRDGSGDPAHEKHYEIPSNEVETDTRFDLVVEYHAYTPDGDVLQPEHTDGDLKGKPYDVDDPTIIPDTIVKDGTVWVKDYITEESDPLAGTYDSDKRIVVVYNKYENAYVLEKEVSADGETFGDSVSVVPGTTVYFRIKLTNTTDYPISGLSLSDSLLCDSIGVGYPAAWQSALDGLSGATIAPNGEWQSGAMRYDVPADAGKVIYRNIATVSDNDPVTPDLTDDATVEVIPIYTVTVNYVDTDGKTIQTSADPYIDLPAGSPYDVLNVGDQKDNYRDPIIDFEGNTYFYVETDPASDPESSAAINGDKEITYVYDLLRDPAIAKAVDKAIALKDDTVTYTLTITNPNVNFDLYNVVITDAVPAGLRFKSFVEKEGVTASCAQNGVDLSWTIAKLPKNGSAELRFTADVEDRAKAIWYNTASITEYIPDVNGDGEPDEAYEKTEPITSNTVETNTRFNLVVEYHAYTPDGEVLREEHHDGDLKDEPYDVDDPTIIPDIIIKDGTVWVKTYITEQSDPLEGTYDSDKRIVVVYDRYDSAYVMLKQVSTDGETWQDTVQVDPGATVYFRIKVANNTDHALSGLSLADEMYLNNNAIYYPVGWQSTLESLSAATIAAKGEWQSGTMRYDVPTDAAASDVYHNIATVSDSDENTPDLTDDATVTITPKPELKITKTANIPANDRGVKYAAQGETVPFTLVVSNPGNTELYNVNVIDDTYDVRLSPDADAAVYPAGSVLRVIPYIAPYGQSEPIIVYYTVPEDTPAGQIMDNFATAKTYKTDEEGQPVLDENDEPVVELTDTDNDDITVILPREPRLSITKTVNDQKQVTGMPGEYVSYTITISNTGGVDARNVLVADYMYEGENKLTEDWAIDKTWTIARIPAASSYVIEDACFRWQVPIAAKDTVFDNFADLYESPEAYEGGEEPIDSDKAVVIVGGSYSIEVTKAADEAVLEPLDTAGYAIYVTNKSNAPLTDVLVTESLDGEWGELPEKTTGEAEVTVTKNNDNTLTIDRLEAGDSIFLTFDYVIPEGSVHDDEIINTVSVEAPNPDEPEGDKLTDSADAAVRIHDEPLKLVKKADSESVYAGDTAKFTITVTNIGKTTLHNVLVTDDHEVIVTGEFVTDDATGTLKEVESRAAEKANASKDTVIAFIETLEPGACHVITVDHTVPEDSVGTKLVNTATATDDKEHSSTDSDDVQIDERPVEPVYAIEVVKFANVDKAARGETVTYTLTVRNTGNSDLHNVVLTDTLDVKYNGTLYNAGEPIKTIGTLRPGKSESAIVTYVIPNDFSDDKLVNTAYADSDETERAEDDVEVVLSLPSVAISKTVSSQNVLPGERVYYTITVTNNGNVDLTDVRLTDPSIGYDFTIPALAVGEKWTTPSNTLYYVFSNDAARGNSFKNTATASNGVVKGAQATAQSTVVMGSSTYNGIGPMTGATDEGESAKSAAIVIAAIAAALAATLFLVFKTRKAGGKASNRAAR